MLIHALANSNGRFLSETFNQGGIKIKLNDVAFAIAFQALMEGEVPPVAEAQDLEDTSVQEVTADLLSHPHAHMLGNLLCPSCMWNNFGDCFKNEMQVPDRNAFREQELQDSLQSRVRDL